MKLFRKLFWTTFDFDHKYFRHRSKIHRQRSLPFGKKSVNFGPLNSYRLP